MRWLAFVLSSALFTLVPSGSLLAQQARTVEARVLGRLLAPPPALAPPPGVHQEIVVAEIGDGSIGVLVHRFLAPAGRLPRGFFNAGHEQRLTVAPMAGCPARLRALVLQKAERDGKPVTWLAFVRLRNARRGLVMARLDDAPVCYLLAGIGGAK